MKPTAEQLNGPKLKLRRIPLVNAPDVLVLFFGEAIEHPDHIPTFNFTRKPEPKNKL